MRWFYYVICSLFLTGCVNYAGIKGQATPLTPERLHTPQSLTANQHPYADAWWQRFHDPILNGYIATALAHSPNMQIAENRVRKARYLAQETNASRFPSLSADGYATRERFSQTGLVPPPYNGETFNIGDAALHFNYEFDFWGQNKESYASALSEAAAAKANEANARLVLASAIAFDYFQLASDLEQIQLAKHILATRVALSHINGVRNRHGIDSAIPVKTTVADAKTAELNVIRYQEAASLMQHELAVLMGENPLFAARIRTAPFRYQRYPLTLPQALPANLLAYRPDIIASRAEALARAHTVNAAKARFFPNINLIGLFSYQSIFFNRLFQPGSQNNLGSVAIDLPIFDANNRRSYLGASFAAYDIAINQYNQTILNALKDVTDQLTQLRSLQTALQTQAAVVSATQARYKLVQASYNQGITDYAQVLALKGELLQQQTILLGLQTDHLHAVVAMIKALGGNPQVMRGSK